MSRLLYIQRRATNLVTMAFAVLAMGVGLFWLSWLLWTLFSSGMPAIQVSVFTQITPPPGSNGGLLNAIVGSVILTLGGVLLGAPIGVLAGTYLAEFGRDSRLAATVRFISDVLLSAPSIIIGVFVYEIVVRRSGHFSAWAGIGALAIIVLPVVVRTSEDMLRLVPNTMREAAAALGAPQWKVTLMIVYRAARAGILTGILLSVARISGETAPLLFTALNNQFWSTSLDQPIANLPAVIFQFAMSPYEDWHRLAWAGALIITLGVLLLNILARSVLRPPRFSA
ncbi:MAG: phosphate ABC transporter permease PstA [Gammaproteobacteria bacterium]|nr:phosphate ABC transporter permease PstA [Gammaproteobacteria bacterium]